MKNFSSCYHLRSWYGSISLEKMRIISWNEYISYFSTTIETYTATNFKKTKKFIGLASHMFWKKTSFRLDVYHQKIERKNMPVFDKKGYIENVSRTSTYLKSTSRFANIQLLENTSSQTTWSIQIKPFWISDHHLLAQTLIKSNRFVFMYRWDN